MNAHSAIQHIVTGAVGPSSGDWAYGDYQNAADAEFKKTGGTQPTVVTVPKNGPAISTSFARSDNTQSQAASDAYDSVVESPGQLWYIALYDPSKTSASTPNPRIDETYLGGMQTSTTIVKKTKGGIWGWIVGIAGSVGLTAIIASGKKGR